MEGDIGRALGSTVIQQMRNNKSLKSSRTWEEGSDSRDNKEEKLNVGGKKQGAS